MSLRYPIALAALHAAPYSIEAAFLVPSVQQRVTSAVHPSSALRATGLPTTITPTTSEPSFTAIPNFHPTLGR